MSAIPAPRRSATPVVAVALGLLVVALTATNAALVIVNHAHLGSVSGANPASFAVPISAGLLGFIVASRRPANACGWLLIVIAILSNLLGVADQYARLALLTDPGLPGAVWAEWVGALSVPPLFPAGAVSLLLLLLPEGHLPSRRWRWFVVVAVIDVVVLLVSNGLGPGPLSLGSSGPNYPDLANPVGIDALAPISGSGNGFANGAAWFAGLFILVVASVMPFVRMRRARAEERQQLKWIAYAVLTTVGAILALTFLAGQVLPSWTWELPIIFGFGVAFPVAIGIAIFKHRLYDIDIVISRTLVYGTLALFITAVYVVIAVGVGALIGGGGKPNLGLSILATAIVAVGFQPLRELLQRVANSIVYGKRATPYEVLAQFSERVAESYAMEDVLPRMARVLAEGTGAQRADVWLLNGDALRSAAAWPESASLHEPIHVTGSNLTLPGGSERLAEVRHQGEQLGALSIVKRRGEALTPIEENLLAHLAAQAGLVLRNVRLTANLQARLEELRASRRRLVRAQDDERRKLERNLHDGAQQHLVAIKVKLGLAEMLASRDPEKARATIEQLKADTDEALQTLRDLARGIYPPLLAERGLVMALEAQARKATVPVTVEGDGVARYPQEVEATVYFCVLEALQNAQKYAGPSRVMVTLDDDDDELAWTVADDGCGFDVATMRRGAGLTNMSDRLDALGGSVSITSSSRGTTLQGQIPLRAAVTAA